MSHSNGARASLLERLRQMLGRQPEHSLRESIAELVQEAADEQVIAGEQPELDRQERALIANVRLRETTADDVMLPRADIVAMRVDVTLEQALLRSAPRPLAAAGVSRATR
jgi:magnesium and cobalt transporter